MAKTTTQTTPTTLARGATAAPAQQQRHVFEREFLPLADDLFSFAWRLTNDPTRAEDLVQETYLKAWRFIDRYEAGTYAKAWLFKICRNAFINDYRTRKNQPYKVDFEDVVVYHNEDDAASHSYLDLHEEMFGQLMGDEVTRAINELSPAFRLVLLLDLEDFTYEEIAAIADVPIGTVRSRLHRARAVMAAKLRDYAGEKGYNVSDGDLPPG